MQKQLAKYYIGDFSLPTNRVEAPAEDIRVRTAGSQHVAAIADRIKKVGILKHRINVFVVGRSTELHTKISRLGPTGKSRLDVAKLIEMADTDKVKFEAFAGDHTREALQKLHLSNPTNADYQTIPVKLYICPTASKEVAALVQDFGVIDNLVSQTVSKLTNVDYLEMMRRDFKANGSIDVERYVLFGLTSVGTRQGWKMVASKPEPIYSKLLRLYKGDYEQKKGVRIGKSYIWYTRYGHTKIPVDIQERWLDQMLAGTLDSAGYEELSRQFLARVDLKDIVAKAVNDAKKFTPAKSYDELAVLFKNLPVFNPTFYDAWVRSCWVKSSGGYSFRIPEQFKPAVTALITRLFAESKAVCFLYSSHSI